MVIKNIKGFVYFGKKVSLDDRCSAPSDPIPGWANESFSVSTMSRPGSEQDSKSTPDDEQKEREHFQKVVDAFRYYRFVAIRLTKPCASFQSRSPTLRVALLSSVTEWMTVSVSVTLTGHCMIHSFSEGVNGLVDGSTSHWLKLASREISSSQLCTSIQFQITIIPNHTRPLTQWVRVSVGIGENEFKECMIMSWVSCLTYVLHLVLNEWLLALPLSPCTGWMTHQACAHLKMIDVKCQNSKDHDCRP